MYFPRGITHTQVNYAHTSNDDRRALARAFVSSVRAGMSEISCLYRCCMRKLMRVDRLTFRRQQYGWAYSNPVHLVCIDYYETIMPSNAWTRYRNFTTIRGTPLW